MPPPPATVTRPALYIINPPYKSYDLARSTTRPRAAGWRLLELSTSLTTALRLYLPPTKGRVRGAMCRRPTDDQHEQGR